MLLYKSKEIVFSATQNFMKFKEYINEKTDYKKLVNMIAIVNNKKELKYITNVVEKSLKFKLINDKEYKKLQQEIENLKRGIK